MSTSVPFNGGAIDLYVLIKRFFWNAGVRAIFRKVRIFAEPLSVNRELKK